MTYPFLAACLWLLAWLFVSITVAAGWSALRGRAAALPVMAAAGLAAVSLAWSGALLW